MNKVFKFRLAVDFVNKGYYLELDAENGWRAYSMLGQIIKEDEFVEVSRSPIIVEQDRKVFIRCSRIVEVELVGLGGIPL